MLHSPQPQNFVTKDSLLRSAAQSAASSPSAAMILSLSPPQSSQVLAKSSCVALSGSTRPSVLWGFPSTLFSRYLFWDSSFAETEGRSDILLRSRPVQRHKKCATNGAVVLGLKL